MATHVTHATPIHRRFISIDDLPTEVLEPILAAICQDKSSRWKLPLLNRSFNAQFTPLLYRSVVLTSLDQLHRFVRYASDSTTSQARRRAVVQDLTISLPPRPDLQASACGSCKQDLPERLPIAAGPLCAKQFQMLALGYSFGDVVAMAALGGGNEWQDEGLDSAFGLTDLTSDASTARITLVPERDEDRRFLVISEAIRICPMAESLHLDVGTWDWDFDMYYSEVERTDQRNSHGNHLRRTKPLPDGALSYAECEDHRLVAALGALHQLMHFTWTHSRDQTQPPYNQGYISKRKMSVLAYGFDAMARERAAGHPLETIHLHSPQCSPWRNDVLPPYPTWRINLGRCLEPRYHSPAQRLEAPQVNSRRSESPGMHVWYVFCLNLSCTRRDESPTNKSLAQVVLGYGTHGQVDEANTLNFPCLRHISLLEPVGLDLAEYGRLMCHSPSDAKVRITAGCLNKMELSSYRGRQEAENSYLPRLELALTFWLSDWFVRMLSLPLRDEHEDWRKEREEWRKKEEEQRCKKEEEERLGKAKRVKLDSTEKTEEINVPWRHSTNAIVRLVGSSAFRLPFNSWIEDAQDREALFVAAVIEKLCSGASEGGIVATQPSSSRRNRSTAQLAPSKPLWRLLSRVHLSTRPLRYLNEEDRGALQHAVATTLIESATDHARRDLQAAQLVEMPFAKFANAQETAQSLQVLEQVFRDMADVLARAAPLGWEAAERISREEDEAAMAKTKAQRKRLFKKARACLSSSWVTPRSDSAIAHRLEDFGLPLSPSFIKHRLVHLGRVLDDKENFKPLHGWGTNVPCFWLDLDELKLWGIDVRDALITGGESDKDIDWAPAALKEREGKKSTTAERSDGAVYGGAGTGLPEFVRIPIFGGRVPRFVRARYA